MQFFQKKNVRNELSIERISLSIRAPSHSSSETFPFKRANATFKIFLKKIFSKF